MAKKGVWSTHEEIQPVKVTLSRDNDGEAALFVYNTDLETVKSGIERLFGLVGLQPKRRKAWGEDAPAKPRRTKKTTEPETVEA